MVRYLTGVSTPIVRPVARKHNLGLLLTPDTHYEKQVDDYPFWAADNACFNHPERFVVTDYLRWLSRFPVAQRARCLFATAPDVVGNAAATLERSLPVLPLLRSLGYPAALVAQDGLELLPVPWGRFDVLFIGGTTEWKLSAAAQQLAAQARQRGKRVHMGRVNSFKRLKLADDFGCDTVDGTFLKFGPTQNLSRLLAWFDKLRTLRAAEQRAVA